MRDDSNRPWIRNYKLGPFNLVDTLAPYPEVSLTGVFDGTASKYAKRGACEYLGRKFTWEELKGLVDRLAAGLVSLGVGKGDRVGDHPSRPPSSSSATTPSSGPGRSTCRAARCTGPGSSPTRSASPGPKSSSASKNPLNSCTPHGTRPRWSTSLSRRPGTSLLKSRP